MDRFHLAAQDGNIDILMEAGRRECNASDEDGMTPTLWAAFHGRLPALKLIITRGGDPDKCDVLGNTSLHWAAKNGHFPCVSYLVSFGANLWALDNCLHSALDNALLAEYMDIARLLDNSMMQQYSSNKRTVTKIKEKSISEAEKRAKKYMKLQEKARKKAGKEEEDLAKDRERMLNECQNNVLETISIKTKAKTSPRSPNIDAPKSFSDLTRNSKKYSAIGGVARKMRSKGEQAKMDPLFKVGKVEMNGKRTVRSLSGLQRDHQILYVRDQDINSHAFSEPAIYGEEEPPSLFERPGFGNVSFFKKPATTEAMMSLTNNKIDNGDDKYDDLPRRASATDSIGTVGSLAKRIKNVNMTDVEDIDAGKHSGLDTFLASLELSEYISVFLSEGIDLDAMQLLKESDLKELGLPMGPRKKISEAIKNRDSSLENPGGIYDTKL